MGSNTSISSGTAEPSFLNWSNRRMPRTLIGVPLTFTWFPTTSVWQNPIFRVTVSMGASPISRETVIS